MTSFRERIKQAHRELYKEDLHEADVSMGEYIKKAQALQQQAQKAGDAASAQRMFDVVVKLQYMVAEVDKLNADVLEVEQKLSEPVPKPKSNPSAGEL